MKPPASSKINPELGVKVADRNKIGMNLGKALSLPALIGFVYFPTGDPLYLFFFSFFGFLSFFVLDRIGSDTSSANRDGLISLKATKYAYNVAVSVIIFSGLFVATGNLSQEALVLFIDAGWFATLFTYAISFLHMSRKM